MATLTVYPDAGTGATTVDGYVQRASVDETFSTIRTSVGTTAPATNTSDSATKLTCSTTTNQFSALARGFYTFDTSSLGPYAMITSATLSLFTSSFAGGMGGTTAEVVSATPASNNNLVVGDLTQVGGTSFASLTPLGTVAYMDFTLNASGISNVALSGISKFSTITGWDLNNSFSGTWLSGSGYVWIVKMADTSGTTSDPKLVIATVDQITIRFPSWDMFPPIGV